MKRDPYVVLGVARGASFEEIKAAYRRACKQRHPDMGGSHEAMTELNTAYAFILDELKKRYQQRQRAGEDAAQGASSGTAGSSAGAAHGAAQEDERRYWRKVYQDIDDELEGLRRAAADHEDRLRAMRRQAWTAGDHTAWAKLTVADFFDFFRRIARSGLKGLALLFAALVGVGSLLVETSLVSALIMIGAGLGFAFSLAMKSDKGGFMSAALLLFGLMTIWMPPVRGALFNHPIATISVLLCLALIFKFTSEGGVAGMMTGGVLALYVIGVVIESTAPGAKTAGVPVQRQGTHTEPPKPSPSTPRDERPAHISPTLSRPPIPSQPEARPVEQTAPPVRELIAAPGAILKFVAGVPYSLKIRIGTTTKITTISGKITLINPKNTLHHCVTELQFSPAQSNLTYNNSTTHNNGTTQHLQSCESDASALVTILR